MEATSDKISIENPSRSGGIIFLSLATHRCAVRLYTVDALVHCWTCESSRGLDVFGWELVSEFFAIFDRSSGVSFPVPRSKYLVEYLSELPTIRSISNRDETNWEYSKKADTKNECTYNFFADDMWEFDFLHIWEISDRVIVWTFFEISNIFS